MKTGFIDKRKKLLELFLVKICSQPYLSCCEPFLMFLKVQTNFTKLEKDIKIPAWVDISKIYENNFCEFTYFQPDLGQKSEIREFLKEFEEILAILYKVKHLAKLSFLAFARYEECIGGLMNGIKMVTPMFLINKNININSKENYVNPYTSVREWLRADILDVEAMMEAINREILMEEDIGNMEINLEKKKKGLESIQGGKKSISDRIFSKPQEARVAEEERKIEEMESSIEALRRINSICIGKLLQSDIPKFKQQKVYKICITMRNYSKTTVQEYQEIAEQILQIEESLAN